MQLGQSGHVEQARARSRTRELAVAELQERTPGNALAPADKVVVDLGADPDAPPQEPTVFVDLGPEERAAAAAPIALPVHVPAPTPPLRPGTPMNVQRVTPTMPRLRPDSARPRAAAKRRGGMWLVVFVYLLSATALGVSIYVRFVA